MKTQDKLKAGGAFLKAAVLNIGTPLAVGWAITYRCNKQCRYCDLWKKETPELSTAQIKKVIKEMSEMGTQALSFTGGEPLLRTDISEIIEFANAHGLFTKLNSNGALVPRKITEIKTVNELRLSLDGSEKTQDKIRGKGKFKEVIEAAWIAKKYKIEISFNAVLSKYNLNQIDFLVKTAQKFDAQIIFQPANVKMLGSESRNEISPVEKKEYKKTIQKLIALKSSNCKNIFNSVGGLKHLAHFPELEKVRCAGALLSCRIAPNGDVFHCGRYKQKRKDKNCVQTGFKKAFGSLKKFYCDQCACGPRVELSQLLALKPEALFNLVRKQRTKELP